MGCVPGTNSRDILELLTFHGVGRKVFFLILHDVLGDRRSGIVSDVHVAKGAVALGWVKETDVEKPDQIAKELEEWLDPIYFFDVNLTLAGLRQLWYEDDLQIRCRNRQTIQTFAARLQITSLVQKVIEA
jgi:endonuclease III